MVKFLINRPIAVIMTFIALLMLGAVSSRMLPVSLMPDIDIPEITISVSRPNMSAREVESTVVSGMRRSLMSVPGLRDMETESRNGSALIRLLFEYGTDINIAFMEVNERVGSAGREEPPRIIKASATDLPVYYITLRLREEYYSEERFLELSEFAETIIRRQIEQLPEVAMADITGVVNREVYVAPDYPRMAGMGISESDIINTIISGNREVSAINVKEGHYLYTLQFGTTITDVEGIRGLFLSAGDKIITIEDIASVGLRQTEPTGLFYSGDHRGVSMAIIKNSEAKMADLNESLNALLVHLRKEFPEIVFEKSQDQTAILDMAISNLQQNLILGGTLAFLVMFLFLRDARSPFLIGLSIPSSLLLSMLFFHLTGLTINIISLSGLILGVGMMIDNSIIVTDNICQYIERGEKLGAACIKGTNEVIRPLISSVLTTCAVFIPLIFLSGMAGALFYDQAIAIAIGLFVSLVVSVTLLPTAYRLLYLRGKEGAITRFIRKISLKRLEERYERGMDFVFRHKFGMLTLFFSLLGVALVLFTVIRKEKFPQVRYDELIVKIDWNENIYIEENLNRIREINTLLDDMVAESNSFIGEQRFLFTKGYDQGYSEARVYYRIDHHSNVPAVVRKIIRHIHSEYPAAILSVAPQENVFEMLFESSAPPLIAQFSHMSSRSVPEPGLMSELLNILREKYPDAAISDPPLEDKIVVRVDQEMLHLYNIQSAELVYNRLRTAANQRKISDLRRSNEIIPVVLSDREKRVDEILLQTSIPNRTGDNIPLSNLIKTERIHGYKTIKGGINSEFIPVAMQVETRSVSSLTREVRDLFHDYPDINISFSGSLIEGEEAFIELLLVLLIALLLLYFILAAQFESLRLPLIVLLEIPIDVAGALLLLKLFGASLNLMSMIGMIVMAGIIINDSIIKIDTINRLYHNGEPLMKAIYTGGARRLKPIIMTSITTIFATMPFLFRHDLGSELQTPLALAVIGGMALGTFVSLYFIPLSYWFLMKGKARQRIS